MTDSDLNSRPPKIIGGYSLNEIYNEDCFLTMEKIPSKSVNVILTSPFYNTNKKAGKSSVLEENDTSNKRLYVRYDKHIDNMNNDEYCEFTKALFIKFADVLSDNGTVLYNLSYGCNNREGMFKAVNTIITETPFTIADVIVWKKKSAFPNSCSPNKLTRIWEFIFVFCRDSEVDTFYCNKPIKSYRKTGQKAYGNIFNYIEAKNNDGTCPYNKATFSSDLVIQLLNLYLPSNGVVYDPFMGSGTTAIGCLKFGADYIGSEISENQVRWAKNRIAEYIASSKE